MRHSQEMRPAVRQAVAYRQPLAVLLRQVFIRVRRRSICLQAELKPERLFPAFY